MLSSTESKLAISSKHRLLLVLTILSLAALFFRLGVNKLQSWDEAVYAQSAKEMVQGGDWLTLHWNYEKFYLKPPLTIWVTAALFRWFGVNEFNARAFSAFCGIACVLLTFLIASTFLQPSHAFLAGVVLLVTPHFYYYARMGMMDVPLTAFLLLAVYSYIRSKDDKRWWFLVGIAFGLAVLTKGVAAGALSIAIAAVVARDKAWKSREFWIGVSFFILIAGSWHIAMLVVHGRSFVDEYIGSQVVSRSISTFDADPVGPAGYIRTVFFGFLPFSPFLAFGAIQVWKRRHFPLVLGLLGLTVFLIYTLIPTKHPWYIIPVYPVLAAILCSVRRIPYAVALTLIVCAAAYCWMLDKSIPSLHPTVPAVIENARGSEGPLNVPINIAPAVLFYTDRKICTKAPHHSMGRLTTCGT